MYPTTSSCGPRCRLASLLSGSLPILPISQTELSVNVTDEAVQADYLRDFMTVFFSHPATESIVHWGFWKGQHWIPNASLFREDWTPKQAPRTYRDLRYRQ